MPKLYIDTFEEFKTRTEKRDFEICTFIYAAVKKGVDRGYNKVKVFDMVLKADPTHEYSFSLDRSQWKKALDSCLEAYAEQDLFDDCINIKALRDSLK